MKESNVAEKLRTGINAKHAKRIKQKNQDGNLTSTNTIPILAAYGKLKASEACDSTHLPKVGFTKRRKRTVPRAAAASSGNLLTTTW